MSEQAITSRHNPLVKHARAVRDRKVEEQIFIEGLRLAEEAVRAGLQIQDVFYTENFLSDQRSVQLLDQLRAVAHRISEVSDAVLTSISDTKTPQGIVALAARPRSDRAAFLRGTEARGDESTTAAQRRAATAPSLIVILHRINNPANAGAILRTAEAAGATGAISTVGTADLFSPKALRGSMGSGLRLPLWTGASFLEAIEWCTTNGVRTIGASLAAEDSYMDVEWTGASALVVGSEASGLTVEEAARLDARVRIPMRPPVESLNVAVACGIVLYEAARQRKHKGLESSVSPPSGGGL